MLEPITTALITLASTETLSALIRPLLGKALRGATVVSDAIVDTFTNQFINYIERQLEKHQYLNTLVFQNQIPLDELYIPLTVVPETADEKNSKNEITINCFSDEFIPAKKRVLITDTAGMGKSTLMKYLLIQCIRSNFAIPVFIELRHLSQSRSVLALLETELNFGSPEGSPQFTSNQILPILKKGNLLFFFDGYDEIPFKDREAVTKDVKGFIESFPNNYFVLTSRPETGLTAFPSFEKFRIRPLKKEESFALIKKYDHDGQRSKQLIERLNGPELRAVHEFLENPLLTTLLYRCFEYKQNIPEKKHIFYRQVFDALFDWHDASKDGYNTREKKTRLDLDSFHRVLRVIGFISTLHGEVEGDKDTVLGWIRDAKGVCVGLSFSESDFLQDLTTAVPVLVKDGLYYKWSHKSLAEYFAAQYICTEGKDEQSNVFSHMEASGNLERFQNMLDQVYDLDQPAFRKYFTHPFATNFLKFRMSSYKEVDPAIPAEEVELRRACTFSHPALLTKGGRFPAGAELRSELDRLNYTKNVNAIEVIWDVNFTTVSPIKFPNLKNSMVLIRLVSSFSTVGEILASKRDPISVSRQTLAAIGKALPLKTLGRKSIFAVTDDPYDVLNSKNNFATVTRALIQRSFHSIVVDAEACENFCKYFSDEQTKAHFTQSLLAKLTPEKS